MEMQFYKEHSAPAPMVPDTCVLKWGRLHKSLMEKCGGTHLPNMLHIRLGCGLGRRERLDLLADVYFAGR